MRAACIRAEQGLKRSIRSSGERFSFPFLPFPSAYKGSLQQDGNNSTLSSVDVHMSDAGAFVDKVRSVGRRSEEQTRLGSVGDLLRLSNPSGLPLESQVHVLVLVPKPTRAIIRMGPPLHPIPNHRVRSTPSRAKFYPNPGTIPLPLPLYSYQVKHFVPGTIIIIIITIIIIIRHVPVLTHLTSLLFREEAH